MDAERSNDSGKHKLPTVIQFPNKALMVVIAVAVANHFATGQHSHILTAIFYLALAVWAIMELISGVNWFRRLLGAGILIYIVIKLATKI